jgi:predicted nucleic-acid-binding protein
MTGIDTNVLVRYLVKDDAVQSKKANDFIKSLSAINQGFVSLVTIVETIWVLDSVYDQEKELIKEAILKLTKSPRLVVQCGKEIEDALSKEKSDVDLSDTIIAQIGLSFGGENTVTFGRKAAKLNGMRLL